MVHGCAPPAARRRRAAAAAGCKQAARIAKAGPVPALGAALDAAPVMRLLVLLFAYYCCCCGAVGGKTPPSTVLLRSDRVTVSITISTEATFVTSLALRQPLPSPIGCAAGSFTANILSPGGKTQLDVSNTGVGFQPHGGTAAAAAAAAAYAPPPAALCDLAGLWTGSGGPAGGINISRAGGGGNDNDYVATGAGVYYHMHVSADGRTVSLGSGGVKGDIGSWNSSSPPCSYIRGSSGWWWCRRSTCGTDPPAPPSPPPPPPPSNVPRGWYSSSGGVATVIRAGRHVRITGIQLVGLAHSSEVANSSAAVVATEDWTLALEDDGITLRWGVVRRWLASGWVNSDRTPALVLQPSFLPVPKTGGDSCGGDGPADMCTETQMASFVDETMQLDSEQNSGFPVPAGAIGTAVFTEAISKRRQQWVELIPSGLALNITSTSPNSTLNYGKAGIVGTLLSFGGSLVDRTVMAAANITVSAGDTQINELVVRVGRAVGVAPLSLSIPVAPNLTKIAAHFGRTHNVIFGNVFGNSPTSITALEELSVFPMIQSAFLRRPGNDIDAALGAQMRWYARHGFNSSSYLYSRWDIMGVEQNPIRTPKDASSMFGCLMDQVPHYILAQYHQVLNTGDLGFLREQMASIDQAADFLLRSMRMNTEGVPINLCTTGLGKTRPSNWHDTITMGHHDGLVASNAVHAFHAIAEMKTLLGDTEGATAAMQIFQAGVAAFTRVYWSDQHGVFSDWIDSSGRRRDYFYTWHNLIAVTSGLANATQSASIMRSLSSERARLAADFNVTVGDIFCTPSNMRPASPEDITYCNSGNAYPFYLNGDCFLLMSGWEMAALGKTGQSDSAFAMLSSVLAQYDRNMLWGQRYSWQHGKMHGNDILANSLVSLVLGLQASFGITTNLTGIGISGAPAAKLEGARWCFRHLGKDVCVSVKDGQQHIEFKHQ
jgi:hypothetical protein